MTLRAAPDEEGDRRVDHAAIDEERGPLARRTTD
jgi:hypothetical protein